MTAQFSISGYIDPFGCNDSRWAFAAFGDPDYDDLVETVRRFLGFDSALSKEHFERFKKLCAQEVSLTIVPTGAKIFDNVFSPLRLAKKSYITGDYLSTIALCGMVGEMLSIFVFKINSPNVNASPLDENKQKKLWGSTFEKLTQERRIDILQALGYLPDNSAQRFDFLRATRRPYLHLWEKEFNKIETDAEQMYASTVSLTKEVFGIRIEPPLVKVSALVLRYLEQSGEVTPNGS